MPGGSRWSQEVTLHSHALDLEEGVFRLRSPRAIAESLRRSADQSQRRKGTPHRAAMSMLTFYINRAGRNMSPTQRRILERAKGQLRKLDAEREGPRGPGDAALGARRRAGPKSIPQ